MSQGAPAHSPHPGVSLPPLQPGPHLRRLDVVAIVATFGGLLFGYDTGVINGALEPLKKDFGIASAGEGLITASLLIGAAFGAAIGGRLNDNLGRKKTLTIVAVVFFLGTLGCVFAPGMGVMVPSRFVLGLAVGAASMTVPVYLAELAPTERRGALSGRNELAIVIGQMLAFIINAIIFSIWGEEPGVWRYMLVICAIPAVFLFVGMFRMPESPRWLISKNRYDEALAVLMEVRDEERARAEMAEVESLADEEKQSQVGGFSDLKIKWVARLVLIGCGVGAAQQVTGINSIMYYGTQVLKEAGFSDQAAIIANIANGVLSVVGTAICLFVVIDRVARRKLIIFGFCATTTIHGLITLTALLLGAGTGRAWIILALSVTFVFFMQCCLNAPVWVAISELFPLRLRGLGMGISIFVLWVVNALVTFLFPVITERAGLAGMFGIFFLVGLLAIWFLAKMLPNTSGRSLEELEAAFSSGDFR